MRTSSTVSRCKPNPNPFWLYGEAAGRTVFPQGNDAKGRPYQDYRWSRFKNLEARDMFEVVSDHVFPFLRTLGGDGSTYAHHMKDARFSDATPA